MGRTRQSISKYLYDFLLEGRHWWRLGPIVGYLVLLILVGLFWAYVHRHYVLHKLSPFRSLENKIAVDDIMIEDWTNRACDGELYLVDTATGAIRQLTYDDFSDSRPAISKSENRVYFLSNRPIDGSQYPSGRHRLFYLDMLNGEIHSTEPEFRHIFKSEASKIQDYVISGDLMALVEDYDITRLYLIDLKRKVLLNQWEVSAPARIIRFENERIVTQQNDRTLEYLTASVCDSVFVAVDQSPEYRDGVNGLMEYFGRHLLPVIIDCAGEDRTLTTRMEIFLIINPEGKVVDAQLSDHHLKVDCVVLLRKQLLTMSGWKPAYRNGEPVCSQYGWFVRGIKWN